MITVALGMVIMLFFSGLIEGFVTPSDLPTWAKITCGVVFNRTRVDLHLCRWRRAYRAGATGDLEEDAGYSTPVI